MRTPQDVVARRNRSRVLAALVLGIALGAFGVVAVEPAVAASSSDIPGVPLTPGLVVGPLGGSIYDVVYSLDVPPGSVILASLSGSAGTDFDLYLFDSSATTVVTNQGVVARSTGPTSTESLSYATAVGGQFYVDLNSATAAVGTYTLAVQVVADRPAIARVTLDGGMARTNSPTVSVAVSASGSLADVAQMSFSADGITWVPWVAYQATTSWTFADGDGTKTLWARVETAAGVVSGPVTASIVLDTSAPSVVAIDPATNADLVGARPTITVTFSEPIDPMSWTQLGLLVQLPDGELVPGTFTVTSPTVGTFRPSDDLVPGGEYILSVGPVRDVAGNLVAPIGSWLATDRLAPQITLLATPPLVNDGATSLLSGRLVAPAGVSSLTLVASRVGALETVSLGTVPVAADGSFSTRVTPSSSTEYRLDVPAVGEFGAGSVNALVSVRRSVGLNWSSAAVHAGRAGARVSIIATVSPAVAGVRLAFRLERWNPVSRSWRLVGTLNRTTDASGHASVSWAPSGSALYRWRATAGWTPDYSTGSSAWVRWSIAR